MQALTDTWRDATTTMSVLLSVLGEPADPPARALETPEGHTVEYDEYSPIVGLELIGVRVALEHDGDLQLTWPPAHLAASTLDPALAA